MVSEQRIISAAVLVIGDEILSGRTQDRNTNAIAAHLTGIGIRLREARVVADDETSIVTALNALRQAYDYVFTTGGIGPTHDDITAECVAKAFGVGIAVDPRARAVLQAYYDPRGLQLTNARLRMARVPDGADLLDNPVSGAPGFRLGNVIVMAGVPDIMRAMLQAATPGLETGAHLIAETIPVDKPESEIADIFAEHQRLFPDVAMGSYPLMRNGGPAADLVLRAVDAARLQAAASSLRAALGLPL